MKIKTITCHDCYNFGASLQAFALQYYLEHQGHDVEVIHYKPDYLSKHFSLSAVCNQVYDRPIVRWLYLLAKLPERIMSFPRKNAFDNFTGKYLHLTRRYNSYEELKSNPPYADVYIAGSDQIWNTLFPNGRDKAFYLDFGEKTTRRISYAASFATPNIQQDYIEFVKKELENLDQVSIRECCSLSLLKELGRDDGVAVCDPVFLLSKEQWCDLLPKSKSYTHKKYLLVYLTDQSETIHNIVREIKAKTNWKIVSVGGIRASYADKNIVSASPLEFVELVKNAQFVISNSFHASAFSVIMGVDFCVVNRSEKINERMRSLLEELGLSDRLVSSYTYRLLDKIDYIKIDQFVSQKISFSKQWLNEALASSMN